MPFGLTNISAIYQRQNDNILWEYLGKFIIYYLDNILIYIKKKENYKKYIQKAAKKGQIRKSKFSAAANMLIIQKKENPKKRLYIDYCRLNNTII